MLSSLLLLALPVASAMEAAAQQQPTAAAAGRPQYHVVELFNSDTTTLEQLLSVFEEKLGASKEKVMPLIEDIDKKGKAVVVAGTKESCESAAECFHAIGMKTEVRLLSKDDMPKQEAGPSEYDDSDVIVASAEALNELLKDGEGLLINFFAPWCGHCKTMVPAYKEAATTLKERGVRLVAMDGQAYPGVLKQLGVRGFPSLKWLKLEDEALVVAEYQGGRDAASIIRFVEAATKAGSLRSKLPQGAPPTDDKAAATEAAPAAAAAAGSDGADAVAAEAKPEAGAAKSKLGQSKVGGSKVAAAGEAEKPMGVQKAKMPAEAEASAAPAAAAA